MKFQELTSPRLASIERDQTLVVIPIAAVEQHGPHLPTGTDTLICTAVAEALEARLSAQVLLTPTLWLGASAHHLRLGATLDSQLTTYIATLVDVLRSVLDDGFLRVMLLNGHGGNLDPLKMVSGGDDLDRAREMEKAIRVHKARQARQRAAERRRLERERGKDRDGPDR